MKSEKFKLTTTTIKKVRDKDGNPVVHRDYHIETIHGLELEVLTETSILAEITFNET